LNLYQSYEDFEFGVTQPTLDQRQHAAQSLRDSADFTTHILQNMDSIAFSDFDQDRNCRQATADAKKAVKIMQYGMQYYMFAQKHLTSKCLTLNQYLTTQNSELDKLNDINRTLKHRLRK